MDAKQELTSKTRRAALEFADEIAKIAVEAPDDVTKSELYKVVNSMRRRYGYSDTEKLEEILKAIDLGATTIGDLVRETCFPAETIHWGTKLLEAHQMIEFRRLSLTGKGRPSLMIRIVEGK